MIVALLAEIRTEYFTSRSLERYRCMNPLDINFMKDEVLKEVLSLDVAA
jgi:hypothetical protein